MVKSYTINLILKIATFFKYNFIFKNSQKNKKDLKKKIKILKENEIKRKFCFSAVTNVSKFFINEGYAPQITLLRGAYCLVLNKVQKKAVILKGGVKDVVKGVDFMFVSLNGDCRKIGIVNFFNLVNDVKKCFEEFEKYI